MQRRLKEKILLTLRAFKGSVPEWIEQQRLELLLDSQTREKILLVAPLIVARIFFAEEQHQALLETKRILTSKLEAIYNKRPGLVQEVVSNSIVHVLLTDSTKGLKCIRTQTRLNERCSIKLKNWLQISKTSKSLDDTKRQNCVFAQKTALL